MGLLKRIEKIENIVGKKENNRYDPLIVINSEKELEQYREKDRIGPNTFIIQAVYA